jgi:hypothetical protein
MFIRYYHFKAGKLEFLSWRPPLSSHVLNFYVGIFVCFHWGVYFILIFVSNLVLTNVNILKRWFSNMLCLHSKGFWRWWVTLITTKLLDFVHRPDFYKPESTTLLFFSVLSPPPPIFTSYPHVTSHGLFLRSGAYSPLVSSGWPSFVLASPVERQAFGFSVE